MTCREELADGERYPLMKRISRRKRGPVPEDAAVARREAPALRKKRGTKTKRQRLAARHSLALARDQGNEGGPVAFQKIRAAKRWLFFFTLPLQGRVKESQKQKWPGLCPAILNRQSKLAQPRNGGRLVRRRSLAGW